MWLENDSPIQASVIVAHPDDEIIWGGGTILLNSDWKWTIIALCRGNDPDRSPKFFKTLTRLNARGKIGNLDDNPDQKTIPIGDIKKNIIHLLPQKKYHLIITHSPKGEYTRHKRHEETGKAVFSLWKGKRIMSKHLWMFAYEDGNRMYYPQPIDKADKIIDIPYHIWKIKYQIITQMYGFNPESFEAISTQKKEAFWCFEESRLEKNHKWIQYYNEDFGTI